MVTLFVPGFSELLLMVLFGSGLGLPLGVPPGPEDPVVSRVAPEECLFYVSWSGMAKPDPASPNHAEQLLAEKEVQHCIAELEARVMDFVRREAEGDPQAAAMVDPVATVLKAVLTRPAAVFVSRIDPASDERPVAGGAVVNLGEKTVEVEQALGKIEAALSEGAAKPAGPEGWRRLPLGPDGVAVEWAVKGQYLILGLGDGEADKIRARGRQSPPQWLTQLRQQLAVPRQASLAYVNVDGLMKIAGVGMPRDAQAALEALGLNRLKSLACVSGLDELGCVSKTQVAVDGELAGLLSIFTGEPLAKSDLAVIPKDATVAVAARFDLARAYKELLDVLGQVAPPAREELLGGVGQFERQMKFRLSQDIFASVGDAWRIYNSPGQGGLILSGLTAVVNLRDRDRLVAANGKLVFSSLIGGAAREIAGRGRPGRGPKISQSRFGDQTIFTLTIAAEPMPFAPSWCITESELVVALYPQNVRAYLSRSPAGGSLADVPAAAGLFAGGEAPMALGYCDTPALFKMAYPIVQIVAQIASSELQREGIDLDVSLLPSAPAILRHLQPTVAVVRRTGSGVVIETRGTLPVGGGGALAMAWLAGAGPRGLHDLVDFPTPQKTSINNLRQIGLAMHNYHDTFTTFPASAGPRKPGQPPVSWRVLILPFVEQQALYQQYRFDEPWDSEHNKKLAANMPAVFKAPGSKAAAEGKTNYLAVVGDPFAFAADKGRPLREFRDGTSNTILVVEVSDEKAVPWTKPEDFTPEAKNPSAGLVGLRPGGFLATFADGAVRRIPAGLDAATLHALFTRASNEPVSAWELDRSGGRVRSRARPAPPRPAVDTPAVPEEARAEPAQELPRPEGKADVPERLARVSGTVTFHAAELRVDGRGPGRRPERVHFRTERLSREIGA